jgi:flagellar hook protein FlgE
MMRSMFAGVSGLKTHQTRMDVIGNNIANVNTVGYKAARVTFKDMLYQQLSGATAPTDTRGGTNPQQIGLGVTLGSIDVRHTQGNTQATGYITDLAIEGDGFFVLAQGDQRVYTRAGAFGLDNGTDGNLVSLITGARVLGYKADMDGKIDLNAPIQTLHISTSETIRPRATTRVSFAGNLDVRYSDPESISRSVQVFDSRGKEHTINVIIDRVPGSNQWDWRAEWVLESSQFSRSEDLAVEMNREYVVVDDGAGGFQLVDVDDNTKIIARSTEGRLWTLVDPSGQDTNQSIEFETALTEGFTVRAAGDSTQIKLVGNLALAEQGSIYFNADGSFNRAVSNAPDGSMAISLNPELADPMAIELDFSSFTQFADTMTARFLHQNGYANGTLESFSMDQNGRIVGSFSNGLTRNLGQIALARFANTGGLERVGSTMFVESANSGNPQIGAAGLPGYGSISPSSLEMSNVDLSEEFTDLIITQRGFQANSRVITSSDEMLQELVNLKR